MKSLALAFICKNEEHNLKRFEYAELFKDFNEVVAEDTGSTDNTVEFLLNNNVKLSQCNWKNDFSFHRNNVISNVESDYIMFVEPDVKFGDTVVEEVRKIINKEKENVIIEIVWSNIYENGESNKFSKYTVFPNDKRILFKNAIHETITETVTQSGYKIVLLDTVQLDHYGYYTPELIEQKSERNFKELKKAHKNEPNNLMVAFNLAVSYFDFKLKDLGESLFLDIIKKSDKPLYLANQYLSYIAIENKQIDKGYNFIVKACEAENNPVGLNYKGYLEMVSEKFNESLKSYNAALKVLKSGVTNYNVPVNINKEMIKSYEGLIISLHELGKFREIVLISKKLSQITEITSTLLISKIAKAYLEIGDMNSAKQYMDKLKKSK